MSSPEAFDAATNEQWEYDTARFHGGEILGAEDYDLYRPGGYHPVHLGDLYDNDRYRVVYKLGAGGYSTVWLAHDAVDSKWAALKIVVAEMSTMVEKNVSRCKDLLGSAADDGMLVMHLRHFSLQGPNGSHLCLVMPFCGPSCDTLSFARRTRLRPWLARKVACQAAEALHVLHSHGICHGGKL